MIKSACDMEKQDILQKIVAYKREELLQQEKMLPLAQLEKQLVDITPCNRRLPILLPVLLRNLNAVPLRKVG